MIRPADHWRWHDVLALMWWAAGCASSDCPDTRFAPAGDVITTSSECPAEDGMCPFLCDSSTCSGTEGALTCEDCVRVEGFVNGDCSACEVSFVAGAVELQCELRR